MLFPEGSRGDPEIFGPLKKGIGHLASARPHVPVIPIYMHGLGKALPKGSTLLVPFNCTANVGEPLYGRTSYNAFLVELEAAMAKLAEEEQRPAWE
jgi:1-acyl-sn-glycerol-3-phosphate acyltransferase